LHKHVGYIDTLQHAPIGLFEQRRIVAVNVDEFWAAFDRREADESCGARCRDTPLSVLG
jgi:hypothetical protein